MKVIRPMKFDELRRGMNVFCIIDDNLTEVTVIDYTVYRKYDINYVTVLVNTLNGKIEDEHIIHHDYDNGYGYSLDPPPLIYTETIAFVDYEFFKIT